MKKILLPAVFMAVIAFACSKKDSSSPGSTTTTTGTTSTTGGTTSPVLKASFTANKKIMDLGDTLRLSNTSTGASVYEWDFGDGSYYGKPDGVAKIYQKRGTFKVVLTVFDNSAKKQDTMSMMITVGHKQLTGFTVNKLALSNPSGIFISANPNNDQSNVNLTDTNNVSTYPVTFHFKKPIDLTTSTTTQWVIRFVDLSGRVKESVPPTVDLSKVFTSYIQMAPGSSTQDVRLNYNIVK